MSNPLFNRRDALKIGCGTLFAGAFSQPAEAQNLAEGPTVFVGSNEGTPGGESGGAVYAIDAETGEEVWAFDADHWVRSDPIIVDGTLYVTSQDGFLYAINTATGEQEWQFDLGSVGEEPSPSVSGGNVYIGGPGLNDDPAVYAIDSESGDLEWSSTVPDGAVDGAPAVAEGRVYVGSRDETVYALDADTGNEAWRFEEPTATVRASPTYHDGIIYIGAGIDLEPLGERNNDNTLYAIDADTGDEIWRFDTTGRADISPAVANGTVYIGTAEEFQEDDEWETRGTLHAIDIETGEEEWNYHDPDTNISSAPTVVDGMVCFGVSGLVAVDAETGDQEWQVGDPAVARSAPTSRDGVVYVGMDDAMLYAVDAASGEVAWTFEEPSSFVVSSPTIQFDPVDGHSLGSRAALQPLSHHDQPVPEDTDQTIEVEFAEDTADEESDGEIGGAGVLFRQTREATTNPFVLTGAGIATVGAGYFAYRSFQDDTEILQGPPADESLPEESQEPDSKSSKQVLQQVEAYDELDIGEVVEAHSTVQINRATTQDGSLWVLAPVNDGTTVSTKKFDEFFDLIYPWTNIDDHPHLLSVYGHGTKPVPWVAVEIADRHSLQHQATDLTTTESLELLVQVCEAVHHIQRYGLTYEHLSPESVLVDDTNATLRGVLDHVNVDKPSYELPTTDEAPTSEQGDVYRLGALAYEVLTGTVPAHPDPTPPSDHDRSVSAILDEVLLTALAEAPEDRYETVLHFRDELEDHFEQV